MRTKLIIMSLLLALACRAYDCPVCELANGPLITRQIPGSENTVREYFKDYKDIDTIYAIVDPVGLCPRCEAVIMPVFNRIKQTKPSAKTFLIAGYHNEEAAKKLRIPAAMLRARMYRARMFIREKYGDEYRK